MQIQTGLINGNNGFSEQLTVSGGINRKQWSVGLGTALDYYKIRTVPVFIDVRRTLNHTRHPFFAYLNTGLNIPYAKQSEYHTAGWWYGSLLNKGSFDRGLYGEIGLGYALLNRKNRGLLLGIGYSIKTVTEKYTETIYTDIVAPGYVTYAERRLDYQFNRVAIKIGVRLW